MTSTTTTAIMVSLCVLFVFSTFYPIFLFNMVHILTKKQLLFELYVAESDARKHKSKKMYVIEFEKNLHKNLSELCDELYNRTYRPMSSVCFIIEDPKKREIFAAMFRDRIVHHLYYNLTHKIFEKTFIYDTYSCIKDRGTHFGIDRLYNHIRKESLNYTRDCYILKMDIKGYFMHIDRNLLYDIVVSSLKKEELKQEKDGCYCKTDFGFIYYLTKELALLDPTKGCVFRGNKKNWEGLPKSKSLFYSPIGYGLPIGNLTSQLFSNVFLNVLDQFCKRELKCMHYGRYVDDFYIVSHNKEFLLSIIPIIKKFLNDNLHLEVNEGKTKICHYSKGVEFLGSFVKPYRKYMSNQSLRRVRKKIFEKENNDWKCKVSIECSINSYLGCFRHNSSYNIRKEMFSHMYKLNKIGIFNKDMTKFYLFDKSILN